MSGEPDDSAEFPLVCYRCGAEVSPGEGSFYVVRIEAFADPTPPRQGWTEPLPGIAAEIDDLLERMRDLSAQELMDQVYRRLTLFLCTPCYRAWIENPTG